MHFQVIFYETVDGKCPVGDFLQGLDKKLRRQEDGR